MKTILFLIAIFMATQIYAQDSTSDIKPTQTEKVLSKADTFMAAYAAKQGVDTNMSTDALLALADKDKTLIPKGSPAKNPFAWLKFISALLFLGCAIYYKVKHSAIQAKALANGITLALFAIMIMGISSCAGSSHLFTANSATVKESVGKQGIYLEEYAIVHTAPLQYDTAAFLIIAPDSVSNTLVNDIKKYIAGKVALITK